MSPGLSSRAREEAPSRRPSNERGALPCGMDRRRRTGMLLAAIAFGTSGVWLADSARADAIQPILEDGCLDCPPGSAPLHGHGPAIHCVQVECETDDDCPTYRSGATASCEETALCIEGPHFEHGRCEVDADCEIGQCLTRRRCVVANAPCSRPPAPRPSRGCGCAASSPSATGGLGALALAGLTWVLRRRS